MSPASSGTLEVERYIGACLISSQNRAKANCGGAGKTLIQRDQFYPREHYIPDVYHGNYVNIDGRFRIQRCNSVEGWAGGMPLISYANHQRRGRRIDQHDLRNAVEDQNSPLARLAVHTQGAPLILTKSYNKKNKSQKNNVQKNSDNTPVNSKSKTNNHKSQDGSGNNNINGVDTISVASDESSGSANSENCLPRIIKPRKRRKKDRKPLLGRPLSQDGFSTDSASPDIDTHMGLMSFRPYIPFNFDTTYSSYRPVPEILPFNNNNQTLLDRIRVLGDISETPKLHHSFEDIEDVEDIKDVNGNQTTTTCQCRYCDPAGQIWDVDRNCYSPFLTSPNHSSVFKFPEVKVERLLSDDYLSSTLQTQTHCLLHSMSSVSLEDDKCSDSDSSKSLSSTPRSSSDLEVSTEIVTSLNGHRDLEIKFFSLSSAESARKNSQVSNDDASDRGFGYKPFCDPSKSNMCSVNNYECKILTSEE